MLTPEELKQEIQLIFARACAEGLREESRHLMDIESFDIKKAAATQYAAAFSSAFAFVAERFTEGPSSYDETPGSGALRSTPEAAPQSAGATPCQPEADFLG